MPCKKNYGCENDSSSLCSVTGLSANASCNESSDIPRTYSVSSENCSDSYEKSCGVSSSSCSVSSSSCNATSSEVTFSDKSTNNSCIHPIPKCSKECSTKSYDCESESIKKCEKLVRKYNCSKEALLAITDIIVVLNFIKNKLIAVQPNINLRQVQNYAIQDNINWLESFVDTLFCVLRKNEAYKVIKVRDCKVKNDDEIISNRTYIIKIKYLNKREEVCENIPIVFRWIQLTNNEAISYKKVLDYTINQLDDEIKAHQAAATLPFLST